jgi:spore coat polysaccharide biosynthesis protein SpsF
MKIGAIIFSRFSSQRLPGKALMDISGRSLLGRVIDRTREIQGIHKIIIATSTDVEDDQIENFSKKENIEIYRGSLDDVASRALDTCVKYNLDKFVRICGDRPFFSPNLISKLIELSNSSNFEIITTTFPRTYPPGLTCEILNTKTLMNSIDLIKNTDDKEHVTSYFYKHPDKYSIKNFYPNEDLKFDEINLCVDTQRDLERAIWIANQIDKKELSYDNIPNIIALAHEWDKIFPK